MIWYDCSISPFNANLYNKEGLSFSLIHKANLSESTLKCKFF